MNEPAGVRGAVLAGILWMVAAAACQGIFSGTVRRLAGEISVFELVFFQSLIGVLLLAPLARRLPAGSFARARRRAGLYAARAGLYYLGALLSFFAFSQLDIANVQALLFAVPVFTILLASLMLGERVGARDWAACAVGFAGALVIIRPGIIPLNVGALSALAACGIYAMANIVIRKLAMTEDALLITVMGNAIVLPIAAGPAALAWVTPNWRHVPWILALGIFFALAQLAITRSIGAADARIVQPFSFLRLPCAALVGWALFGEFPDALTWIGAAVIFLGTWDVLRRETRRPAAPERPA